VATCSLESGAGDTQYRWENEQGEAVYSDRPPPAGIEYQTTDTHPGLNYVEPDEPVAESPGEESTGNPEGDSDDSAEDGGSEKDAALCEKARMNLIALKHRGSLTVRNETGQARALSPEDLEFAMENARQQIERYCD